MATERQVAANRRNAQKSTGPRSVSGKKRASKNALRHALSKPMAGPLFTLAVEDLARRIVRDTADASQLELAREAAEGMLELRRISGIEAALVARVSALGRLDALKIFVSKRDERAWILEYCLGIKSKNPPKFAVDKLPPMPVDGPQRTIEAIQRTLPALLRLQRYKRRAVAKRDRAVRAITLNGSLR